MGCCSSDDTGNLPVLHGGSSPKKRNPAGAGAGADEGHEEVDDGAQFLEGIYTKATESAQDTLKTLDEFTGKGDWDGSGSPEAREEQKIGDDNYHGQWIGEERNGYGVCVFKDGSIYEGFWQGDQRQGRGRMVYRKGAWFDGDWSEDKREG